MFRDLLLAAVTTLLCLSGAEYVVRRVRPQTTYRILLSQAGGFWAPSDFNGYRLRPGYRGIQPSMEFPGMQVPISINSLGLRGPEIDPDRPKLLALGDSYTFGVHVGDDETYPAVLQRLLSENGSALQVLNAGYAGGHETDQQYVWLKNNLPRFRPQRVVLGVYLGNDILGLRPEAWQETDAEGLPTRWIDPDISVNQWGYLRNRRVGMTTVGSEFAYRVPLLRESHLFVLFGGLVETFRGRFSSIQPGYMYANFAHIYGDYSEEFLRKEKLLVQLITAMKNFSESHGAGFSVALLPINFMVEPMHLEKILPDSPYKNRSSVYYARLQKQLEGARISVVNIERAMRDARTGPYFPENGEVHFNPNGNRFTAEQIYRHLSNSERLGDARPQSAAGPGRSS